MQRIRHAQKHTLLGIFLLIGICLVFLSGLIFPVRAENVTTPVGNCSHGYVTNIAIKPNNTAKEYIPDYSFNNQTSQYDIKLYNSGYPALLLSVDKDAAKYNDLYYLIKWEGNASQTTKTPKQIRTSKVTDIPNVLFEVTKASCGTQSGSRPCRRSPILQYSGY